MNKPYELSSREATFQITEEEIRTLVPLESEPTIIGQPRALKALKMGFGIQARGYNIFVTGQSGTGRSTAIKSLLKDHDPGERPQPDIAFVYNFQKPDNPRVLYLPQGKARDFKKDLQTMVDELKTEIKERLKSDLFSRRRDELVTTLEKAENHRLSEFESQLRSKGFQIVQVQETDDESPMPDILPIYDGEPKGFDDLQALVLSGKMKETEWMALREKHYTYMDQLEKLFDDLRDSRRKLAEDVKKLEIEHTKDDIKKITSRLRKKFPDPSVITYLSALSSDIEEHIDLFAQEDEEDELEDIDGNPGFIRYGINIIKETYPGQKFPVVQENHPCKRNLYGTIETKLDLQGNSQTNFMMIRAGSLIQASGGFLILRAEDLLTEENAWSLLKRVLETGKIEIQSESGLLNLTLSGLKPEPVELGAKIIILGMENLYELLYNQDMDFHKYFKISAEFDSTMHLTQETLGRYVSFAKQMTKKHNLLPIEESGIAEVIRYGVRLAEERVLLSTRFSQISDLIIESDYWARHENSSTIKSRDVERAIRERQSMADLPEEKMREMITEGDILLSVKGERVGFVNGLAVHDRGYYAFGSPVQISSTVSPGDEGIINIEKEVGLSGEIHDKWVMILDGFLRNRYAKRSPLAISANICFEQSYSEIDGDSASSTEVYALLSAISGIPLKQNIAVTGSVNQMGDIQPVGGLTEKIEGFFSICSCLGLDGTHGVILPHQNIKNLVLKREVCDAIDEGLFHIYPIQSIDQGMEILTGLPAGERDNKGRYPGGTINATVEKQLKKMADLAKSSGIS